MSNDPVKRTARLGRGLTALMAGTGQPVQVDAQAPRARLAAAVPASPTATEDSTLPSAGSETSPLRHIPLAAISPNPYQPRKNFDQRQLDQLAASIRSDGLIQPIVVRVKPDTPGQFELIAGERRWRAAQIAGLATLPAIVRDLTERHTAEWALIENLQREDLNAIDRAEAFQQLIDRYQLSHEQVASRVGVDRTTITNTLRLLGLHPDVQQLVRDNLLSAGQARAIASLSSQEAQKALAIKAVKGSLSVRQVEAAVREMADGLSADVAAESAKQGSAGRPASTKAAHIADLEQQLSQQLGTRVEIKSGRKKGTGTLHIEFYSLDQFDALLARLGVKVEA
jgi:ParB family chromosome partitioning protein